MLDGVSICSYTPLSSLNPNLPSPKAAVNGRQGLRLHPLHISWICTWPTSLQEQKNGVAVLLGVAPLNKVSK